MKKTIGDLMVKAKIYIEIEYNLNTKEGYYVNGGLKTYDPDKMLAEDIRNLECDLSDFISYLEKEKISITGEVFKDGQNNKK